MGEPGLFFTLTTEPKKQQFMHAALSKMHDLNQLYIIIKKQHETKFLKEKSSTAYCGSA